MYKPETILTLKEQRPDDDETGEPFAFNRAKVINASPVSHGNKGDWTGNDANGVIIVPLSGFGGTLDEPYGKLRSLYDVESIPEPEPAATGPVHIPRAPESTAPTPEEVFAGKPAEPVPPTRPRDEPLGDPGGPSAGPSISPLDVPVPDPVVAKKPAAKKAPAKK